MLQLLVTAFKSELPKTLHYMRARSEVFDHFYTSKPAFLLSLLISFAFGLIASILSVIVFYNANWTDAAVELQPYSNALLNEFIIRYLIIYAAEFGLVFALLFFCAKIFNRPNVIFSFLTVSNWITVALYLIKTLLLFICVAFGSLAMLTFMQFTMIAYSFWIIYCLVRDSFQLGKIEHLGISFGIILIHLLIFMMPL